MPDSAAILLHDERPPSGVVYSIDSDFAAPDLTDSVSLRSILPHGYSLCRTSLHPISRRRSRHPRFCNLRSRNFRFRHVFAAERPFAPELGVQFGGS